MTNTYGSQHDPFVKLGDVLKELGVSRSTFDGWRALGVAPECHKFPNGQVKVRRSALTAWIDSRIEERKVG